MAGRQKRYSETPGMAIGHKVTMRGVLEIFGVLMWVSRLQKSLYGGCCIDVVDTKVQSGCVKFHETMPNGNVVH